MTPEIIKAIIQFMQRADLKGAEVPAFVACINELQKPAQEKPPAE